MKIRMFRSLSALGANATNGLRVIAKADCRAPAAAQMVCYLPGSGQK